MFIQALAELLNKQHLGEVIQAAGINVTSQSWPSTMSNGWPTGNFNALLPSPPPSSCPTLLHLSSLPFLWLQVTGSSVRTSRRADLNEYSGYAWCVISIIALECAIAQSEGCWRSQPNLQLNTSHPTCADKIPLHIPCIHYCKSSQEDEHMRRLFCCGQHGVTWWLA